MHAKTLIFSGLASLAMASPEALDKRQAPPGGRAAEGLASLASLAGVQTTDPAVVASLVNAASSIAGAVTNIPESVISVLATGLPSSVLEDPLAGATGTATPAWFSSLPPDVQSVLAGQASTLNQLASSFGFTNTAGLASAATSTPVPGQTTPPTTAVGPLATGPAGTNGTVNGGGRNGTVTGGTLTSTATDANGGDASATGGAGGAGGQSTTRTSNPGVKPTGAIAASLAGLVGVVGMAIVL